MKIAHLNPAFGGGTGEAAKRIHFGMLRRGADSVLFNLQREIPERRIVRVPPPAAPLDRLAAKARAVLIERERKRVRRSLDPAFDGFSDDRTDLVPDVGERLAGFDLVHVHGASFLVDYRRTLGALARRGQRLVWTLHDMNVFTGGCHYDRECGRFAEGCGRCPALRSVRDGDVSRSVWRRKAGAFGRLDPARVAVVCPSRWLAGQAARSPLLARFRIETIPNGVDLDLFRPGGRDAARERLGLPPGDRIVLFVAASLAVARKGFRFAAEAVRRLAERGGERLLLVAAGEKPAAPLPPGLPCRLWGPVPEPGALRDLYAAADVLVVPSLQEVQGLIVLEAMASGVPVAAFAAGGIPEMVRPGRTGFAVPTGDAGALAEALGELLGDEPARRRMGEEARRVAEGEYGADRLADRYFKIYESLLSNRLGPAAG